MEFSVVGRSYPSKTGKSKITGHTRYINDLYLPGMLYGAALRSSHVHARILEINTEKAEQLPGVRAVLTGTMVPQNIGIYTGDKPPLARNKVRHFGEIVALVAADTPAQAKAACGLISVKYEPLPSVLTPLEALRDGAPLIHPEMAEYRHAPFIHPEPGTNIANRTKIRKGDADKALKESAYTVKDVFTFPMGDHAAMEPRGAVCRIDPDGYITVYSSTQAPFVVRYLLGLCFGIPQGKIKVIAGPIGGGFGGKAGIQLEGLAYLLSRKAGGRPVKIINTREDDLASSPGRLGLYAEAEAGCDAKGRLTAFKLKFLFDSGGYADYSVNISRAAAIACTGPYRADNVFCDSLCLYTNHPFATAFRGFGHIEAAFPIECLMDRLADSCSMDPAEFRIINSIGPGDTTPTGAVMDSSTGNLPACIEKVKNGLNWNTEDLVKIEAGKTRALGIGCFWKAPAIPPNTDAGAVLYFNEDGSVNLITGIVDLGQGTETGLAQIAAEKLKIPLDMVHIVSEVDTAKAPHDWTTAASRSLFMAGQAVRAACDSAILKIKETASRVLLLPPEDLELGDCSVFHVSNPSHSIPLKEIVLGYTYPNGNSIAGQVIGTGKYITHGLTGLDKETGAGNPALEWTLGAVGVEIEIDRNTGFYKVLKAAGAMDAGRLINPLLARGQFAGSIAMGLGYASCEGFVFNSKGSLVTDSLRSYKIPRIREIPEYIIDFIETPQKDGPYGARGLGEQGIIGVPGALANALSRALARPLNKLPLTPEYLWERGLKDPL